MSKLSYAQEVAALEETVAAARSLAGVLPPLALTVAGEVEAQIAVIKELKRRQRAYAAEHREVAAAKRAAMARGMGAARDIRACVVLVFGPKDARIARFGLRIRRRPVRTAATASPAGPVETGFTALRDEIRVLHTAGANGEALGGTAAAREGNADRIGDNGEAGRNRSDRQGDGRAGRDGRRDRRDGSVRGSGKRFRITGEPSSRQGKLQNGP